MKHQPKGSTMYFTTSDRERLVGAHKGRLYPQRDRLADGKVIGVITETERGYTGQLTVPVVIDIPEKEFRSAVEDLMTRWHIVHTAQRRGLTVKPDDITGVETGYPEIDGKPVDQWFADMTMD